MSESLSEEADVFATHLSASRFTLQDKLTSSNGIKFTKLAKLATRYCASQRGSICRLQDMFHHKVGAFRWLAQEWFDGEHPGLSLRLRARLPACLSARVHTRSACFPSSWLAGCDLCQKEHVPDDEFGHAQGHEKEEGPARLWQETTVKFSSEAKPILPRQPGVLESSI